MKSQQDLLLHRLLLAHLFGLASALLTPCPILQKSASVVIEETAERTLHGQNLELTPWMTRQGDLAAYFVVGMETVKADPIYEDLIGRCCDCKAATKKRLPPGICGFQDTRELLLSTVRSIRGDPNIATLSNGRKDGTGFPRDWWVDGSKVRLTDVIAHWAGICCPGVCPDPKLGPGETAAPDFASGFLSDQGKLCRAPEKY